MVAHVESLLADWRRAVPHESHGVCPRTQGGHRRRATRKRATAAWAYPHDVRLEFIRSGKPVENAFIESFNGRLRDERLNAHVFVSTIDAQRVLDAVRTDTFWINPSSDESLDARYAAMKARRNPDYFRNWNPTTGQ